MYMPQSNKTQTSKLDSAQLAASGLGFVYKKVQMLRRVWVRTKEGGPAQLWSLQASHFFSQPPSFLASSHLCNSSNPRPQKGTETERLVRNHHGWPWDHPRGHSVLRIRALRLLPERKHAETDLHGFGLGFLLFFF